MRKLLLGLLLVTASMGIGCSTETVPQNARDLKIDVQGPAGKKLEGSIRASSPGTAGWASKNIDIAAPGSMDMKAGPSEYTITLNGLNGCTYTISLDGKQLGRGSDMVVEDDKGPRITLTIPDKK